MKNLQDTRPSRRTSPGEMTPFLIASFLVGWYLWEPPREGFIETNSTNIAHIRHRCSSSTPAQTDCGNKHVPLTIPTICLASDKITTESESTLFVTSYYKVTWVKFFVVCYSATQLKKERERIKCIELHKLCIKCNKK